MQRLAVHYGLGEGTRFRLKQMTRENKVLHRCVLQLIYFSKSPPLSQVQVVGSTILVNYLKFQVNYLKIQEDTTIQVNYLRIQVNYLKIQVNYLKIQEDTEVPSGWLHDPNG